MLLSLIGLAQGFLTDGEHGGSRVVLLQPPDGGDDRGGDLVHGCRDAQSGQLGGVLLGRLGRVVRQEAYDLALGPQPFDRSLSARQQPVAEVDSAVKVEEVGVEPPLGSPDSHALPSGAIAQGPNLSLLQR